MIDSILAQKERAYAIYLCIPKLSRITNEPYHIPSFILNNPHITILYSEKDWRPAAKFIPTILNEKSEGYENSRLIVLDDDSIYPKDLVQRMNHWSNKLPNSAIVNTGTIVKQPGHHAITKNCFIDVREPQHTDYLTQVDVIMG